MAGLKINIDFDLNKFNRLVKRVNELKLIMEYAAFDQGMQV